MNMQEFQQDVNTEREQGDMLQWLEYLQVIWYRRKLIIATTLFAALLGFVHVNQLKNIYTAQSSLILGLPKPQVVNIEQVLTPNFHGDAADSEIEIMRSRSLAEKVIERLNLLNQAEFNPDLRKPEKGFFNFLKYLNPKSWIPADWKRAVREAISGEVEVVTQVDLSDEELASRRMAGAVSAFLGKLSLVRIEYTNIITISFRSLNPELAARVANELPEAYIDDLMQAKLDATRKATAWLTRQLEEQKQKVAESERAVEIYRERHNLAPDSGVGLLADQVSELNSQLIVARAQRIDLETRLEQVNNLLENDNQGIEFAVDMLASPVGPQLYRQEAEAVNRAAEMSLELGPKHPRMLQVNAEITDIRERMRTEIESIQRGLANELELARAKAQNIERSLRTTEADAGLQNREAIQLRALEREASANSALFDRFLSRLKETSSTEDFQTIDARVISAAEVPSGPSAPNRKRTLIIFILGGFLAGYALALLLHTLRPGLLSPEQVERELRINTLGVVPLLPSGQKPNTYMVQNQASAFGEALNSLKISLQLSDPDNELKVLQFTSSVPEEGKSSLSLSLGIVLARAGKRVLLVDADLRRTGLGAQIDVNKETPGLLDMVISEDADISRYVTPLDFERLDFMSSGDVLNASPTDIFSSRRMEQIVAIMREHYDMVLFDAPPVMAVADARVISRLVDKTLFVVRWDKTPRKVARAALDLLRQNDIPLVGAVLQQVNMSRYGRLGYGDSGHYYVHGRYGQYYQD
jgi:capsular exopolysaccharide synthesis family protein